MKTFKKIIALALCSVMMLACTVPALAEDWGGEPQDCCEGLTPGDANENGEADFKDVSLMIRYSAGYEIDINLDNANVLNDDEVNMKDVALLIRVLAGWTDVRLGHLDTKETVAEVTCVDAGVVKLTCGICGSSIEIVTAEPFGHEFEDGVCIRCGAEDENAGFYRVSDWLKENDEFAELAGEYGEDSAGVYGLVLEYEEDETGENGKMRAILGYDLSGELGEDPELGDIATETITFMDMYSTETEMEMLTFVIYPELINSADEFSGVVVTYMYMDETQSVFVDGMCGAGYDSPELTGTRMDMTTEDFVEEELTAEELAFLSERIETTSGEMLEELAKQYEASTGEAFDYGWLGFAA